MIGQKILSEGDLLTPQRLALLASQGNPSVNVRPLPRVAVLSTGDELIPVGQPLEADQLYESNALMLCLLGEQQGWTGWSRAHVRDDREAMIDVVRELAEVNDFLLLSGGVSVGDHDHVRPALQTLDFTEHFWRVRVQPGKPVLFGRLGNCHILGLPGNPVSSFVSFHLVGMRALRCWQGLSVRRERPARLTSPARNTGDRPHYLRGRYEASDGTFAVVGLQRSHGMLGLAMANAIARIPPGTTLAEGDMVEVLTI